ncbi:hypothetical protein R1sor_015409 [Riccia sorocarpa]|uniref:Complex 1 LYR protein domain-containing protein n=1 Tax=Riccia sorocarpa TaxID=122646 RepID=A0ABD3HC58_9MARC
MAANAATRARALALYRKLLRAARAWPGPEAEKQYIRTESRSQFEANRHITKLEEIDQKIFEGESRHDIAWHYKIPYPRLHNFPVGSFTEKPSRITGPAVEIPSDEMGTIDEDATKPSGFRGRAPGSSLSMRF